MEVTDFFICTIDAICSIEDFDALDSVSTNNTDSIVYFTASLILLRESSVASEGWFHRIEWLKVCSLGPSRAHFMLKQLSFDLGGHRIDPLGFGHLISRCDCY